LDLLLALRHHRLQLVKCYRHLRQTKHLSLQLLLDLLMVLHHRYSRQAKHLSYFLSQDQRLELHHHLLMVKRHRYSR
jgi:hypothetical protein